MTYPKKSKNYNHKFIISCDCIQGEMIGTYINSSVNLCLKGTS